MAALRNPRRFAWLLAAGVLSSAGGCAWFQQVLGMQGGYLLQAEDALVLPGETVMLRARLRSGSFLWDKEGQTVTFALDGKPYQSARTDDESWVSVPFTPPGAGDYKFLVDAPPDACGDKPKPTALLVACRAPDAPIAVVDLDRTVMEPGWRKVLAGDPQPMPGAPEVMRRIAGRYTVVYLTHRPRALGPKTEEWLARHGFPDGVILLANRSQYLQENGEYKSQVLRRLGRKFKAIQIGIGDWASDIRAYQENHLRAVMVVYLPELEDPAKLRRRAEYLDKVPPATDVVTDWRQVEQAVFEGKTFPRAQVQQELYRLADELQRQPKLLRPAAASAP